MDHFRAASATTPLVPSHTSPRAQPSSARPAPRVARAIAIAPPSEQQTLMDLFRAASAATPIAIPRAAAPVQPPTSLIPSMDSASERVAFFVRDIASMIPAVQQARHLTDVVANIMQNPDNAPELLLRQFGLVDLFHRTVNTPTRVSTSINTFRANPNIENLGAAIGVILEAIAIANEVLPIANRVVHDIIPTGIRHPKKIPEKVFKLAIDITVNKILALGEFCKQFANHPLKALWNTVVIGTIRSPELLGRNIRDLFTGNRAKKKKARARARAIEAAKEKARVEISNAVTLCSATANRYWMRDQRKPLETYLTELFEDWKAGVNRRIVAVDFIAFINLIRNTIERGQYARVLQISPRAHLSEPSAPTAVTNALMARSLTMVQLNVQAAVLEQNSNQLATTTTALTNETAQLRAANAAMQVANAQHSTAIQSVAQAARELQVAQRDLRAAQAELTPAITTLANTTERLATTTAAATTTTTTVQAQLAESAASLAQTSQQFSAFLAQNRARIQAAIRNRRLP